MLLLRIDVDQGVFIDMRIVNDVYLSNCTKTLLVFESLKNQTWLPSYPAKIVVSFFFETII